MSKQKMKDNEQIIIRLREEGRSRQEIADILGLTKAQIKDWITRYNRRKKKQAEGVATLPAGRPRKDYPQKTTKLNTTNANCGWQSLRTNV